MPSLKARFDSVRRAREESKKAATKKLANAPHRFGEIRYKSTDSVILPSHSSEGRAFIPMGYLGPGTVISNAAFAVYDAEPWLFALLTSQMHMAWVRAVGGKIKTDFRYSNTIVYNNFPVPEIADNQKAQLTETALRILDVREYHCERTLAELYDRDSMPRNLREAHEANDALVDSLYSSKLYVSDEDRLADLFALYEEMIAAEEAAKPVKRKRKTAKK